jgi:hypothetical protein
MAEAGQCRCTTSGFVHWDFGAPVESQSRAEPNEGKGIGTASDDDQQADLQAFVAEADDCAAP